MRTVHSWDGRRFVLQAQPTAYPGKWVASSSTTWWTAELPTHRWQPTASGANVAHDNSSGAEERAGDPGSGDVDGPGRLRWRRWLGQRDGGPDRHLVDDDVGAKATTQQHCDHRCGYELCGSGCQGRSTGSGRPGHHARDRGPYSGGRGEVAGPRPGSARRGAPARMPRSGRPAVVI